MVIIMKVFLMPTVIVTDWFLFKINLEGNIMKSFALVIASVFAVAAFAAEPAKTPAPAASAPAKVEAKKDEKKPVKSDSAKKDAAPVKAAASAAK
jgi:hypothetical protein